MTFNIIYKGDNAYQILRAFNISTFQDRYGNSNPQLLGEWVKYLGGDHVLQDQHRLYICKTIEEATILEENVE